MIKMLFTFIIIFAKYTKQNVANRLCSFIKLELCICFMQLTDAPDMVALNVLSIYIESCFWSISQSDVLTVEQAIQTFSFSLDITTIFSVEITWILNEVFIIACPGQPMCSGHGSCINAACVCDSGTNFFSYMLFFFYLSLFFACVVSNM